MKRKLISNCCFLKNIKPNGKGKVLIEIRIIILSPDANAYELYFSAFVGA